MNRQLKGILAGCGVLAVLGGGLAAVLLTNPGDGGESSGDSVETPDVHLWSYESDAVSRVTVEQPEGDTYTANRRIDQTKTTDINGNATVEDIANYYLEGYEKLPMATTEIRLLTTRATDVHAAATIEENAADADLAKYGLDDPVRVTLTVDDADDISFLIGDATPVSSLTYVCMAGEKTVYTVSTTTVEPYLKPLMHYLGTAVTAEQADDDTRLVMSTRVERKDLDYDMLFVYDPFYEEHNNSGSAALHVMQEPIFALLNAEKSANATHGLFGLSASEVLTPFPTDADKQKAGLDDPFAKVTTVMSDGEEMVLLLGNTYTNDDGETLYYGYFEGVDCIYGFSDEDTLYAKMQPKDVTSMIIIDMFVWDVGTLKYSTGSTTLDFSVIGESADDAVVTLNGERCENVERYRKLYTYLLKTAAEDLILEQPEDVGAEMASVYVEMQDHSRHYDIKFYEAGSQTAYIEIDGLIKFRCRKSYVTTLIQNIEIFNDETQEFTMSW